MDSRKQETMPRFTSLEQMKSETRRILRDRLNRNLPALGRPERLPTDALSDERLLKLLIGLSIEFGSDVLSIRKIYESAREKGDDSPAFEELIRDGWVREIRGRIRIGRWSIRGLRHMPPSLQLIRKQQYQRKFSVSNKIKKDAALAKVISNLTKNPDDVTSLSARRPGWVAARLWESTAGFASPEDRLGFWIDRYELIGSPRFVPYSAWILEDIQSFNSAALNFIRNEPGLLNWDQARRMTIGRMARASGVGIEEAESAVPKMPSTLIDRFLWTKRQGFEMTVYDECQEIWGLVNVLFEEVAHDDQSAVPHPIAEALFGISRNRPEILSLVVSEIGFEPVILADLLLTPFMSALACLLIAQWTSHAGAWDRELVERDNSSAHLATFSDAIAVAAYFARTGSLPSDEIASLLAWMYEHSGRYRLAGSNMEEMQRAIRSEFLAQQPQEILRSIVGSLLSGLTNGLGSPQFTAALDVISTGGLEEVVNPQPLTDAYILSIQQGDYSLSEREIDPVKAVSLVQLARQTSASWAMFLTPLDVHSLVSQAQTDIDKRGERTNAIIRGIRAHVRILCRALKGWEEEIPQDVLSALIRTIRFGAIEHVEKGRVAAFAAQFEEDLYNPYRDKSIAVDLGETLGALPEDLRADLLKAILEIDEPVLLAKMLPVAPRSTHEEILMRISALTPSEAAKIYSLAELQDRIDRLLSIGALDAAKRFIEVEREQKTLGKVAGRQVTRLRFQLRLKLLENDFEFIAKAELPPDLDKADLESAKNVLDFYKALSEISKPNGNPRLAEGTFERLHKTYRNVSAYVVNLFAARVTALLPKDLFGLISKDDQIRVRRLISETQNDLEGIPGVTFEERGIHSCNRSLLLLAIGEPEQAYEILQSVRSSAEDERVAAYSAVALSRIGRIEEARETLLRADRTYGKTELVRAARAQVEKGTPFGAKAETVSVEESIRSVKSALHTLSQMDPIRQAMAVSEPPDFEMLVVKYMRTSAASIVSLFPVLRVSPNEDDITMLLREILRARIEEFLHWSASDQSKGGVTAKGNPGERDLALEKEGNELAVVEAVVCRQSAKSERKELLSHFQKLFRYSACSLFFHVTYSYVDDPTTVLNELLSIASTEVPAAFRFLKKANLQDGGSLPRGFVAEYEKVSTGKERAQVVFLVLDLYQQVQRDVAKGT
jgi:tetratricopeptide (TPR) repeat protein